MKILLFDNSSITPTKNDFCVEPKTGLFAVDLKDLGNIITLYGQKVLAQDTVHTFNLLENDIKVSGLKRKKNKTFNYILLYIRVIPEILKTDFVYIFYPTAFKFIPLLCWLFRKKFGLYVRGMNGINDKVSVWNYKKAFTIFTVSDFFTEMINKRINKETANTIKPMIPFSEKDVIMDRDYSLSDNVSILYLGRIAHDKGIAELLKATKILKDKGYNFELNLVGSGEFLQKAKQLIQEYSIDDIVFVRGAVFEPEEVKSYYINAHLYVLPTYHEGFPRTLYEAMIFGTPIITTFVGGIPALMRDGWNCKEIQPKSTESIVEALEFAFFNYDRMIEFAKNGSNTVSKIVDCKRLTHAQHLNKIINKN